MKRSSPETGRPLRQSTRKKLKGNGDTKTSGPNNLMIAALAVVADRDDSFLGWRDLMTLSVVNKEYRSMVMGRRLDAALKPLLKYLDKAVGSNRCCCCNEIKAPLSEKKSECSDDDDEEDKNPVEDLDPRFKKEYDSFPTPKKCEAMVDFVALVVQNMRKEIFSRGMLDDPADPSKTPEELGDPANWCLGLGTEEDMIFGAYTRRRALALNIGFLSYANDNIRGNDHYFTEAMAGIGPFNGAGGSVFGVLTAEHVSYLCPFDRPTLVSFVRRWLYPNAEISELLGPNLVNRLILAAPFFKWIPPTGKVPQLEKELNLERLKFWNADEDSDAESHSSDGTNSIRAKDYETE
ncbi:MAG: hypothetical protein SGILL_007124 [Bacillariaceae sp.]